MNLKKFTTKLTVFALAFALVVGVGVVSLGTMDDTKTTVTASGEGLWIYPGLRKLNPEVFGSPDRPKMLEDLPLAGRKVSEDGEKFTTTKKPGPFSNKVAVSEGELSMTIWDKTPIDSKNSKDKADLEATFKDPSGENTYRVVLKKLIPVGPHHQFFGGAATNVWMHGSTGIGEPFMPATFSYVTLWGLGDFYRNGEKLDERRLIHVMLTPKMRSEDNELGFGIADRDKLEIHFIMPPTKVSGGHPEEVPLPTKLLLPNGNEQPFVHFNFYGNIEVEGNKFLD
ncbi:MAG: hypothetical protein ABEJ25_04210 [Candidatus Bipolaricaulia bacterium]